MTDKPDRGTMDRYHLIKVAKGETGNIMILTLLILAVLSLVGITAMTTSISETNVTRTHNLYHNNFALAEAAARMGALAVKEAKYVPTMDQAMIGVTTDFLDAEKPFWMHKTFPVPFDISDPSNWDATVANTEVVGATPVQFIVRYDGGSKFDATGNDPTYPFRFTIFGRSAQNGGEVIVQVAYLIHLRLDAVSGSMN